MSLSERIRMARGEVPAALVLKNARVFHLTDGSFEEADIAIDDDGVIAGVGNGYEGRRALDARGLTAVPGFIDTHTHLESSLMLPWEYERCVTRHGVTTAVCDPHELANVVGTGAFDFFFAAAQALTMDLRVRLSSCVPATHLETSGAEITVADLRAYKRKYGAAALGEYMNVPGVLTREPQTMAKLATFDFIDGHAPLVGGRDLNAYIAAGVRNCHESSLLEEAREKVRRGMQVFIREGSAARNLDALMPLMTAENAPFLAFCTDDRNPLDMEEDGHIDRMLTRCMAAGIPPLVAYRVASWSPANGLDLRDRGLIAPGRRADIALLSDLAACRVERVIVHGMPAEEIHYDKARLPDVGIFRHTVKCRAVTADDFQMRRNPRLPVIGVIDGSLVTDRLDGLPPDAPDVLPIAVLERHGRNGNIGQGFVRGFGLKRGAIASSVGHDSHNLCVVGTNGNDMAAAIEALRATQGGFVATCDGKVAAQVPLPVGGLFSEESAEDIAKQLHTLRQAVRELGCPLHEPFLALAFLPLPVIPHLKLTDMGLVDLDNFQLLK